MIVELILFVIAGVICYRFFKVLGQRPENEVPPEKPNYISMTVNQGVWGRSREKEQNEEAVVPPIPDMSQTEGDGQSRQWVAFIQKHDPAFDAAHFLSGAAKAFFMITQAFYKEDKETLKALLVPGVYKAFVASIDEREKAGQQEILDELMVESVSLQKAELKGKGLMIQVLILSQQKRVLLDTHGNAMEPEEEGGRCEDLWTFKRALGSEDPIWYLAQTEVPDEAA